MSGMCCSRLAEKTRRKTDAKKSPSVHHGTTLSGCVFATKAYIDNRKKNLLNSNISPTCPYNMANFRLIAAEIRWRVRGTPANFNGFRVLAALLHGTRLSSSGRQPNFAALNRGRHLYSAGRPSRWALAHISTFENHSSVTRLSVITGSIARYLSYSEADFEVFRPAGATRCTDRGEIWRGGGDRRSLHAKFCPHRCNG